MNEDTYHGKNRTKRSTSGWNGYYLGDIWKSRSSTDTTENGNHHTYPPSEVLFKSDLFLPQLRHYQNCKFLRF